MSRAAHAFVADLERVSPKPKLVNKLRLAQARGVAEIGEKQRILARDVAAFDRMCADRARAPRKPPALSANPPERVSAGALALRRDKVLGVYDEARHLGVRK